MVQSLSIANATYILIWWSGYVGVIKVLILTWKSGELSIVALITSPVSSLVLYLLCNAIVGVVRCSICLDVVVVLGIRVKPLEILLGLLVEHHFVGRNLNNHKGPLIPQSHHHRQL
jgi:hypothetical protein